MGSFVSSCGWVVASPPRRRGPHRQGDGRRSVHRSAKMAPRRRFGAFVYTIGPWAWVVGSLGIAIVYTNGRIGPFRAGLGRLCTLLRCCGQTWGRRSVHRLAKMASPRRFGAFVYTVATRVAIRIATRVAPGGTSVSATMACRRRLLAGPSRLVGKTGSERVAPLPGWHLRQDVNPHEPLKSQKWDLFKAERTVASTLARLHEHMEFHRFNPNATEICIFLCHGQVPVQ